MFSNQKKQRKAVHFEIIPMIDVMMILMLFLAVMAFMPQVQGILTEVPPGTSNTQLDRNDLMVNIRPGAVEIEGESVTMNQLVPLVQSKLTQEPERRVVVAADRSLPYELVVRYLSELQRAGVRNVALATED